ncbi:MAG: CRISPR-associated endoribonuclease Cas6 [bacterium]
MRLQLTLGGKPAALPYSHNHFIQAALYEQITQPALRDFLHQQGFQLGGRPFKLFTFSRLEGSFSQDKARKEIIYSPPLRLAFCSPFQALVQEVGNGLLRQGALRFGRATFTVERVETSDPKAPLPQLYVRMNSPLVVYSTLEQEGKPYTYYYSPFEPRFNELVRSNLFKKHIIVYGRGPEQEDFSIQPHSLSPQDFKLMYFKDTVIKGWLGSFRLEGDPQLLELALHAGLGSKNSEGFGCCEQEKGV